MQRTIAILCIISTVATLACGEFILYDDAKEEVLSEKLIQQINSNEKSTWKAGRNTRFEGMTVGQLRTMLGAKTDGINQLPKITSIDGYLLLIHCRRPSSVTLRGFLPTTLILFCCISLYTCDGFRPNIWAASLILYLLFNLYSFSLNKNM